MPFSLYHSLDKSACLSVCRFVLPAFLSFLQRVCLAVICYRFNVLCISSFFASPYLVSRVPIYHVWRKGLSASLTAVFLTPASVLSLCDDGLRKKLDLTRSFHTNEYKLN